MSDNKLYVTPGCINSLAVMVALNKVGMSYELVLTDKKIRFSKEFRTMNPLGTVPVLQ